MAPLSAIADRRNLSFRIASGVVLGPLVLLLAFLGGYVFAAAAALASAIGLIEWCALVSGKKLYWTVIPLAACLIVYWLAGVGSAFAVMVIATVAVDAIARAQDLKPLLLACGIPYVGLTMLSLVWLRDSAFAGWQLIFFVLLIVWSSDIGAYFTGRALKGPKLAPTISPNKTWSGCLGGLVLAGLVAFLWTSHVIVASRPTQAIGMALILSILAQAGDLFESAIKRLFNAKDSGALIPGHGGMLDRIDGLLWAAPAFALLHAFGFTASLLP